MKYFYALLSLTILLPFKGLAQRNFKPGYIVSLKGDTTKGLIDYRKWNENPRLVSFELAGITQQYSHINIRAFGVDHSDNYQLYTGPISKAAVSGRNLSNGIDSSFVNDTVFLRTIFKGKNIALYTYTDEIKTRFFISEKNDIPFELKRYVYRDTRRSGRITESNNFRQQLTDLAVKYQPVNSTLADKIQRALYNSPEIENVVAAIDGSVIQQKKPSSSRGGVVLFAGLSANYFKTAGAGNDDFFAESEPSQTILPGINFGMDMHFNKKAGKLIYRTEIGLSVNNVKLANTSTYTDNGNTYRQDYRLTFKQLTVSLTPQLIFNVVNKQNYKAYLSGGVQINLTAYKNFDGHLQEYLNNTLIGDGHRTDPYLSTIYTGGLFKAGCVLNNLFELYAGYSTRSYLGSYIENGQSFNVNSYRVGINYQFGKK